MAAGSHISRTTFEAYLRHVKGGVDRLYAVVDAARDKELAFAARDEFGLQLHTLFDGELAPYLDDVAPHLIPIEHGSGYVGLWAKNLGRGPGILLLTEAEADVVRAHLRQIFVVTDEEGKEFFFRFYDPWVLRVYMPTCTAAEAREFFGPIRRILVESEKEGTMLSCGPDLTGVNINERALEVRGDPSSRGSAR